MMIYLFILYTYLGILIRLYKLDGMFNQRIIMTLINILLSWQSRHQ